MCCGQEPQRVPHDPGRGGHQEEEVELGEDGGGWGATGQGVQDCGTLQVQPALQGGLRLLVLSTPLQHIPRQEALWPKEHRLQHTLGLATGQWW